MPNVYNLSFGTPADDRGVDDKVEIPHDNLSRVFSTILLYALSYIEKYPGVTIGVDGSNDIRAYLYHKMFISNREYLADFFIPIGVDYYVRFFRNGNYERDEKGFTFTKPKSDPFDFKRKPTDLYRYYMFHKKPLFF